MFSVEGYFDGTACIAIGQNAFRPNQRLIITALDEDFTGPKEISEKQKKLNELHSIFGSISHDEAEEIRNSHFLTRTEI